MKNHIKKLFSNSICATETSREANEMERCFSIYNQLWRLLSAIVSFALAPFVPLYGWKVCVCAHEDEVVEKRTDCEKRKGRTERSLPLQRACLSSPFQAQEERKLGGAKDRKQRRRIWRIRGPDWVSNKYSEKQSVLTLFPSWPGYALKESDNFAAQ